MADSRIQISFDVTNNFPYPADLEIPSGDPVLVRGNCEACFLAEATVSVGLAILCEGCAVDHAWERFLDALKNDQGKPRKHRRTWAEL